jgi:hypothetical protein
MYYARNLDPVVQWKVKDDMWANCEYSDSGKQIVPQFAQQWITGIPLAFAIDLYGHFTSRGWTHLLDANVMYNLAQILLCIAIKQQACHYC